MNFRVGHWKELSDILDRQHGGGDDSVWAFGGDRSYGWQARTRVSTAMWKVRVPTMVLMALLVPMDTIPEGDKRRFRIDHIPPGGWSQLSC